MNVSRAAVQESFHSALGQRGPHGEAWTPRSLLRALAAGLSRVRGLEPAFRSVDPPAQIDLRDQPVELLGALYESLLESGARKSAGAFYTGGLLAEPTVARTLAPGDDRNELPRVIDPAMGCGAFLLAALRHLVGQQGARQDPALRAEIALSCLSGLDIDPLAAELAVLSLWIEVGDAELDPARLEQRIRVGDGLSEQEDGDFDAVIGNPPWEILRPNAREFLVRRDRTHRGLTARKAKETLERLLAEDEVLNRAWSDEVGRHRELTARLRDEGRFRLQGRGDLNTYKLFLERGLHLLRDGGRLGMILPSGLAFDLGCRPLRDHLLDHCSWEWLFLFENRDGIFDIHRSYRFGPVVVQKGGVTDAVATAFRQSDPAAWQQAETAAFAYPRDRLRRFSPEAGVFHEIEDSRELELLERIFEDTLRIGDRDELRYVREFDLTNDARQFLETDRLLRRGVSLDRFGRLLGSGRDRMLPLYQGVMIRQFDPAAASHGAGHAGRGTRADWRETGFESTELRGRFVIRESQVRARHPHALRPRLAFRDVQNASNERTLIATLVAGFPCGNTLPVLTSGDPLTDLALLPWLSSYPLDRVLRLRMSQNHVNWFTLRELPLPAAVPPGVQEAMLLPAARLALYGPWFAAEWLELARRLDDSSLLERPWRAMWALTARERLRWSCVLDALCAHGYGLDQDDLDLLLRGCEHPPAELRRPALRRQLDPKGFWRVDRDQEPELRRTVLTRFAFRDLRQQLDGGEDPVVVARRFCGVDGDGWDVPHPLRDRLGPAQLPWQEQEVAGSSWRLCEEWRAEWLLRPADPPRSTRSAD